MKTNIAFFTALTMIVFGFSSCKKDKKINPSTGTTSNINEFHQTFGEKTKTYKINAASGGSFTTEKGTKVTIPANCFANVSSGEVNIHFKDITTKSEMLFSDFGTVFDDGTPLKSGGEFFIKAEMGDTLLQIAGGMKIDIEQPFDGKGADNNMLPMIIPQDTVVVGGVLGNNQGWVVNQNNTITVTGSSYIFSLYQFGYPLNAGTWCNSDNPYYFTAFTQTHLNIHCNSNNETDVFLLFKDENSMIHVYKDYQTTDNYKYEYAPIGKKCTVVIVSYLDGKLVASFTPITISANHSITPVLTEMSEEDFEKAVKALD